MAIKKNNDWFVSLNDSYMPKAVLENINGKLNRSINENNYDLNFFIGGSFKKNNGNKNLIEISLKLNF